MHEHILHVSIANEASLQFALAISEKYGHGTADHAIAFDEFVTKSPFALTMDFREVYSLQVYRLANELCLSIAPDDALLIGGLQKYLAQTYNIIHRCKGFDLPSGDVERYYTTNIGFWASYIQKHQISMIMFYTCPHESVDFILYQLAKVLGLKVVINSLSLDSHRSYYISSIEDVPARLVNKYAELQSQYKNSSIDEIPLTGEYSRRFEQQLGKESQKIPWYMARRCINDQRVTAMCGFSYQMAKKYYQVYKKDWKTLGASRKFVVRLWLYSLVAPLMALDSRFFDARLSMFFACLFRKEARDTIKLIKKYNELSTPADFSKKYVYFPLHYQPECTSNPQGGGMYYNQAIPIRILSASLPEDVYIFVKEHPTQNYGARRPEFYSELLSIPRVVLVREDTSSYDLLKHCLAVSTLVGTAGWEGLFYQKPFIMFGYWVTMCAPGVYHVRTVEECKAAVDKILSGQDHFTLKDLRLFFKAMDESECYNIFEQDTNSSTFPSHLACNIKLFDEFYHTL